MPFSRTPSPFGRRLFGGVLAFTLGVSALGVGVVTWDLRTGLREQVLAREGETLAAVASLQMANEAAQLREIGLASAPGEVLVAVLKAAPYRGVVGIRVFDARGGFSAAVPWAWSEESPSAADLADLRAGRSLTRLISGDVLGDVLASAQLPPPSATALEVWVNLRRPGGEGAGYAQFLLDGTAVATELSALDGRLVLLALMTWASGALVITLALWWAFGRWAEANRRVSERSEQLEQANRRLLLAAKTAAVGSITAHLLHELKTPLAGLEQLVRDGASEGSDFRAAAATVTRRLRAQVDEVLDVLRDQEAVAGYALTAEECVDVVATRARVEAGRRGVSLATTVTIGPEASLPGRMASLTILVLQSLTQNALEASKQGGVVRLVAREQGANLAFEVADSGPGLSPEVEARLFEPLASGKAEGSGLGLALSQLLAHQAGGRIELVFSGPDGTVFRLVIPRAG
jgi:signal transduction histidine kinase